MFRKTYYSTRHQSDASSQDIPSGEMNTDIDENILRITKCLEEADIYVATSKSYVEASRGKIELLKKTLCQADVDLSTAGECIMESEMRIGHIKQELQSLFNKSFYSRPETVQNEIVDESRLSAHRTICEPLNCSLPSNISNALTKYANRLKIDLKNYKTSFEQHDNLALVVMQPLHRENHCNPFWFSQNSSSLQQCTSNSDNLKKKNDSFHEQSVSKSSYSQTRSDDGINNSYINSSLYPCLPISEENTTNFPSGSSAFVNSQRSIRSDVLNYSTDRKMLNESVVTSGTLYSNSNMSLEQNKTLDAPETLYSNSNMSLEQNKTLDAPRTLYSNSNMSLEQNKTLDKVPDLVNNLNGLTFDRQSVESRKWSRLDASLPPRKRYGSSDVSPIRLSESSDLPSSKPSRAGSSKHVLVKIHSSDSGDSEWESTEKSEDSRKTPKDDLTKNRNETEDLIKLSSSGSSETSPLLLKESGCQNTKANANVSIDMKMGAGSELSFSQDTQISNSFKSINSSYDSNTFTKNYLKCTQPDINISHLQSCRPKTLSQSFREKCTREKEASAVFDDCLEKARLSIITKKGKSETFGAKKLMKYFKNQSQESDVENMTLDGLSLTGSVEINDACINPLSYYESAFDYSQTEPFGSSQYKKKGKLTSTESLSASVNINLKSKSFNGMENFYSKTYKKLTKESDDTTYSSVGKSSTSGNITSGSSHSRDNEFYSLQAKKDLTSKSPSYFSLTEDVFYSTQNTDFFKEAVSDSDVASTSIAMNTSCSTFAGNSNSNVLQTDNSFSSGNANTSVSINVNTSDASITSESQRTANETFSKPLFENTWSSDNFEESLRRRDSTESYVTVYEAQAGSSRDSTSDYNHYDSGRLSQRSGLEMISEEYTAAASIPRISITSHSRNAVYTYIPKARLNTSTPKPESSITEI